MERGGFIFFLLPIQTYCLLPFSPTLIYLLHKHVPVPSPFAHLKCLLLHPLSFPYTPSTCQLLAIHITQHMKHYTKNTRLYTTHTHTQIHTHTLHAYSHIHPTNIYTRRKHKSTLAKKNTAAFFIFCFYFLSSSRKKNTHF